MTCSLQVPGVYVWRGGFTGRPEQVDFEGRGASSVEYYLDGVPYVAQGVDSIAVDPSLFSISFLERVEVERWPGLLKVHLFTQRHDRLAPRSRVGIARGDRDFARYEGDLERRFPSGIGFGWRPTISIRRPRAAPAATTRTHRCGRRAATSRRAGSASSTS